MIKPAFSFLNRLQPNYMNQAWCLVLLRALSSVHCYFNLVYKVVVELSLCNNVFLVVLGVNNHWSDMNITALMKPCRRGEFISAVCEHKSYSADNNKRFSHRCLCIKRWVDNRWSLNYVMKSLWLHFWVIWSEQNEWTQCFYFHEKDFLSFLQKRSSKYLDQKSSKILICAGPRLKQKYWN